MTSPHNPGTPPDTAEQARRTQEAFTAAAHLLATHPEAVQRALIEHRRTVEGRCHHCGPTARWPCAITTIAHQAVALIPR